MVIGILSFRLQYGKEQASEATEYVSYCQCLGRQYCLARQPRFTLVQSIFQTAHFAPITSSLQCHWVHTTYLKFRGPPLSMAIRPLSASCFGHRRRWRCRFVQLFRERRNYRSPFRRSVSAMAAAAAISESSADGDGGRGEDHSRG